VIAEDQALLRAGLARLFEDSGHEIVSTHPDGEHLLEAVTTGVPDLVVIDIRMPPSFTDEGVRVAQQIKSIHPEMGVLLLSQHVETERPMRRYPLTTAVTTAPLPGAEGRT
jgi:DNA-binding NarL/FixJ family response regulator